MRPRTCPVSLRGTVGSAGSLTMSLAASTLPVCALEDPNPAEGKARAPSGPPTRQLPEA